MYYLKEYVGRETPLYYAERISEKYGAKIYLKREWRVCGEGKIRSAAINLQRRFL